MVRGRPCSVVTGYPADGSLFSVPAAAVASAHHAASPCSEAVERALDAFGGVRRAGSGLGSGDLDDASLDAELAAMAVLGGEHGDASAPLAAPEPVSGLGAGLGPSAEAGGLEGDAGGKAQGKAAEGEGHASVGEGHASVGAAAVAALRAGVDRLAAAGSALVGGESAQRFWKWLEVRCWCNCCYQQPGAVVEHNDDVRACGESVQSLVFVEYAPKSACVSREPDFHAHILCCSDSWLLASLSDR